MPQVVLPIPPLQPDFERMKEGKDYKVYNGYLWFRTRPAARMLNISREVLNRDCMWAIDKGEGNLADCKDYILEDTTSGFNRQWWVRSDINTVYFMKTPGKGRENSIFPVASIISKLLK